MKANGLINYFISFVEKKKLGGSYSGVLSFVYWFWEPKLCLFTLVNLKNTDKA
jgi:hypothetical protein